jgi:hypothetical protein
MGEDVSYDAGVAGLDSLAGEKTTDNSKSEIQGFFAPLRMTT